ncbi:MAG: primosomal protein N' [Candidatus Peribacteraceae bacterium]
MYCTVVTSSRSEGIGNGLTYETSESLKRGMPVRVPLRSGIVEGIVVEVMRERDAEVKAMKKVKDILGDEPLLTDAQLKTARWMASYYATSLRQALSVWLPPPPWSLLPPREFIGYTLSGKSDDALRGKKQIAVIDFLRGREWTDEREVMRETGASKQVLKRLLLAGIIAEERRREDVQPAEALTGILSLPILSSAQEEALRFIQSDQRSTLLFGVTGSGKTEVYAQLIADAVRAGKQALLLVPEILLTEQSIDRFTLLLDRSRISVLHSKLTTKARRDEWRRIARGDVSLVIGSRSALFAPLRRLGLLIVDEEHEWTYKNEQSPRYHVRETAETLCRNAGAKLVLGSATPSLESWSRAKNGSLQLVRLSHRYQERSFPRVAVVDLASVRFGKLYPFSPPLLAAIDDRLKRKEQCVLFLNRRGLASALLCFTCRRRVTSPESQLPFTVHSSPRGESYLVDHTSGATAQIPARCPHCGSTELHPVGAGTQKIEYLLKERFPKSRILRADSDTLKEPLQLRTILKKMQMREADILLGTQSVAKGIDLPGVTLAAVLLADLGLSLPHFRAGERVFQLLTQLVGRSGRGEPGEVIIQTFRPEAPEVLAAASHETEKFLDNELKLRAHAGYPPFTRMIRLLFRREDAMKRAKRVHDQALRSINAEKSTTKAYLAPTYSGGGKEWHVLLRGSNPRSLLQYLDLKNVSVDVDPVETM